MQVQFNCAGRRAAAAWNAEDFRDAARTVIDDERWRSGTNAQCDQRVAKRFVQTSEPALPRVIRASIDGDPLDPRDLIPGDHADAQAGGRQTDQDGIALQHVDLSEERGWQTNTARVWERDRLGISVEIAGGLGASCEVIG